MLKVRVFAEPKKAKSNPIIVSPLIFIIERLICQGETGPCPAPVFVARDRGKSPPRLHKAHVEAKASRLGITLKPRFPFKPTQPYSIAVGPMKPLQGSTPVGQPQAHQTKTQRGGLEKL
jgi:hypothetical protein